MTRDYLIPIDKPMSRDQLMIRDWLVTGDLIVTRNWSNNSQASDYRLVCNE